jgi:hypothetical protein
MIDTTNAKAKKGKGKKQEPSEDNNDEEEQALPKVGVKRKTRPVPASDEQQIETSVKVKRIGDGTQETKTVKVKAPAKKKVVKKPTEFKAGKWNPDTVLVDKDIELEDPSNDPIYDCCHLCNGRNVFRAINTNNVELLRKLVYDTENIFSLLNPEPGNTSPMHSENLTPLSLIMKKSNLKMLEVLLHIKIKNKGQLNGSHVQEVHDFYALRTRPKPFLLNKVNQGTVSERAYGARIRSV